MWRCTPQDEAALESLVLERGLPSVEFIWCVTQALYLVCCCAQSAHA